MAMLLIAGCNGPTDRPSADASGPAVSTSTALASVSPPSATAALTGAAALVRIPLVKSKYRQGPEDAPPPPGGDLIDQRDYGPGRWRSCLVAPAVSTFEHTAHCGWNEARTSITEVLGLPTRVGDIDIDGYVAFDRNEVGYSFTYEDGRIVTYGLPRAPLSMETGPARLAGQVAFELAQYVDPELGVVVDAPPVVGGTLAWVCGDPPAPG